MDIKNKNINALWIGKILSPIELLTIQSFIDNGHAFVLWAYDTIETPLPQGVILHDAEKIIPRKEVFCYKYKNQFGHGKGSFAGFSDIFRYKLLYEYGGWWVDMDVTCLEPFDFEAEYVFRTHHDLPMVGNIMKCPPKSKLMKHCYELAYKEVTETNTDWHKPIQILVNGVQQFGLTDYIIDFSNPDSWNLVRQFLVKNPLLSKNWKAIHWVNEEWRRNNIHKHFAAKGSLLYNLQQKHHIKTQSLSTIEKMVNRMRLSYFLSGLKQLV